MTKDLRRSASALVMVLVTASCSEERMPTAPKQPRVPRSVLVKYDGTGDYPTIQAAIDASQGGDTIRLENGRFRGSGNRDLVFGGRNIVLRSDSGNPEYCVIDVEGLPTDPHRGMTLRADESGCIVEGITIERGFSVGGGAAIRCEIDAAPILRNLVFRGHRSVAVNSDGASPVITGCKFTLNIAGGIACYGGSPVVTSCDFVDNYGDYSGGGITALGSGITIRECRFTRNLAEFGGGAIDLASSSSDTTLSIVVEDCSFDANAAGYYGGAALLQNVEFLLRRCSFTNNSAANGAAVACRQNSIGILERCLLYGNQGTEGSAVASSGSLLELARTILVQNGPGEVVSCDSLSGTNIVTIRCSDVYGNAAGDWVGCIADQAMVTGNISADPLFCETTQGDFRLQPDSPCISACGIMGPNAALCSSAKTSSTSPKGVVR